MRSGRASICPHEALLAIPKKHVPEPSPVKGLKLFGAAGGVWFWRIKGVRMYVASGTGDVHTTDWFEKVPSLTNCSGELSLKLDERVVVDGRAAAVFDIFAGTLDAFRHQAKTSSIWAKLTVPTPQPELRVTRIWDQQDGTIPLRPADDRVDVWLMNVGANPKRERKNDFLLTSRTGYRHRPG